MKKLVFALALVLSSAIYAADIPEEKASWSDEAQTWLQHSAISAQSLVV